MIARIDAVDVIKDLLRYVYKFWSATVLKSGSIIELNGTRPLGGPNCAKYSDALALSADQYAKC
jgi:hypothetical protein